jgi:hypothetical protein
MSDFIKKPACMKHRVYRIVAHNKTKYTIILLSRGLYRDKDIRARER